MDKGKPQTSVRDELSPIRRQEVRYQVRVTALVHSHGRFQTVRMVDFSLTGFQLEGCFGVGVGEHIAVELLSGHRLEAKVVWSMGSRVGVCFAEAVSPDHPLVAELLESARSHLRPAQRPVKLSASRSVAKGQTFLSR